MITIKEFSESTGFSIRMLRYLEEFDLIKPARAENNYRYYQIDQIQTAKKIKTLQNLGFQLQEIKSLLICNWSDQIVLVEKVFNRELEIAEVKSEILPHFRFLIEEMKNSQSSIMDNLGKKENIKSITTLAGDSRFHRTAFRIPVLETIFEDIDKNQRIQFQEIDFMKFGYWMQECNYLPDVYTFLDDSTFAFGANLNTDFLNDYKISWAKYLLSTDLVLQKDFQKDDVIQLMGSHDIVIRATFKYLAGSESGEIIIPYAPVFALAKSRT